MPPTEAQRRARSEFKKRQLEGGSTYLGCWLSKDASAALDRLAIAHGSKQKAVEAAVIALAAPKPKDPSPAPKARQVAGKVEKAARDENLGLGVEPARGVSVPYAKDVQRRPMQKTPKRTGAR